MKKNLKQMNEFYFPYTQLSQWLVILKSLGQRGVRRLDHNSTLYTKSKYINIDLSIHLHQFAIHYLMLVITEIQRYEEHKGLIL